MTPVKIACLAFLSSVLLLFACDPGLDNETSNEDYFNNMTGGTISVNDYKIQLIPGSLFSEEEDYSADTLGTVELNATAPDPIPDEYNLVGKIVRFTPENYAFNFPASIYFPAKNIEDPLDARILHYDTESGAWTNVPITLMNDDPKQLGASVALLGIYALVTVNNDVSLSTLKSGESVLRYDSEGGVRFGDDNDIEYWYCITVKSVTSLKYPDQWEYYSDSPYLYDNGIRRWSGLSAMSGSSPAGLVPRNPVHLRMPQGTYQFWISKVKYEGINKGVWLTYSKPAIETINRPLEFTGSWSGDQDLSFDNWYDLVLPTGGTWQEIRPEELPGSSSGGIIPEGDLTDADGNVYQTIRIGNQVWAVENLKTTKYNDGTAIPNVTSETQWNALPTGAYCNYNNQESNAVIYGRLYNMHAVNTGKLAPAGWHVSTFNDWQVLLNYLAANGYDYTKEGKWNIAKTLSANTNWEASSNPNVPGENPQDNNSSGFSGLPAGGRLANGEFKNIGYTGYWWVSGAGFYQLSYNLNYAQNVNDYYLVKREYGASVRLVKN